MNRRNLLYITAGMAVLASIGSFTAKPLWAQIKAALVENIDEPGRNPFHANRSFTSNLPSPGLECVNNNCTITYGAVPSGKRLVITNVTGSLFVDTPGSVVSVSLYDSNSNDALASTLIPASPAGTVYSSNIIGVNAAVLAYFDAGNEPTVVVSTTTSISQAGFVGTSQIALSGYYINLP